MNAAGTPLELSVVIPCYNERDNLRPLAEAIHAALAPLRIPYEIVFTDDCSGDGSWETLRELNRADTRVRAQRLEANRGQSAALWAGMQEARGRCLVTMDADLQNDPSDIPKLLDALKDFDCVCGDRTEARSRGDKWTKIISSRIANRVRNALSHEHVADAGCCYRALRRECVARLKYFRGFHRFLPTLLKMEGFRVTEIPIGHRPRASGRSHYGVWNRLFASLLDLWAVRWMKTRMIRYEIAETIN